MSDDRGDPALTASEKPGGYIEPGNGYEERGYEKPLTQEKPVPAKETETVKKDS